MVVINNNKIAGHKKLITNPSTVSGDDVGIIEQMTAARAVKAAKVAARIEELKNTMFYIGDYVRCTDKQHFLEGKCGQIVAKSEKLIKRQQDQGLEHQIVVDFGRFHAGHHIGFRKAQTHDCIGSLNRSSGFLMLAHQLEILDKTKLKKASEKRIKIYK